MHLRKNFIIKTGFFNKGLVYNRISLLEKLVIFAFIFFSFSARAEGPNRSDTVIIMVDIEEFIIQMKLHENHLLLDVRYWIEFKRGRIPHAILAENSKVLSGITDTLDLDTPLFLYCAENFRSTAAGKSLAEKGFKKIYILDIGFYGWRAAGKEIDKKRLKRTERRANKSDLYYR